MVETTSLLKAKPEAATGRLDVRDKRMFFTMMDQMASAKTVGIPAIPSYIICLTSRFVRICGMHDNKP
jgi:hypothetical protein